MLRAATFEAFWKTQPMDNTLPPNCSGIHDDLKDAIRAAAEAAASSRQDITIWRHNDQYGWANNSRSWSFNWPNAEGLPRPVMTVDAYGNLYQ